MRSSRIQAVDHVRLDAPRGVDADLRWFYGEVVQLEECTDPPAESASLRFRSEQLELRFRLRDDPRVEPIAYRVTIAVPCLQEVAHQLVERGFPVQRLSGLSYTDRRLATQDPAGNRVLLKQMWRGGPL